MKTPPQVGHIITRYEQPVIFRRGFQGVINYLPQMTYTDVAAKACIQRPRTQDLRTLETDDSLEYIKALSRDIYPIAINDLIIYKNRDYKVISVQDWSDYGYYRAIAEEFSTVHTDLDKFQLAICDYVCRIMEYDPTLVVFGRRNFYRVNQVGEYIVIDESDINIDGRTRYFNVGTEKVTHGAVVSNDYTISFYGAGARRRCMDFVNSQRSQTHKSLQRELKIGVNMATTPQNMPFQDGSQYREWWQVTMTAQYTDVLEKDLLRIESAEINPLLIDK